MEMNENGTTAAVVRNNNLYCWGSDDWWLDQVHFILLYGISTVGKLIHSNKVNLILKNSRATPIFWLLLLILIEWFLSSSTYKHRIRHNKNRNCSIIAHSTRKVIITLISNRTLFVRVNKDACSAYVYVNDGWKITRIVNKIEKSQYQTNYFSIVMGAVDKRGWWVHCTVPTLEKIGNNRQTQLSRQTKCHFLMCGVWLWCLSHLFLLFRLLHSTGEWVLSNKIDDSLCKIHQADTNYKL